jgi:hypothetical protein
MKKYLLVGLLVLLTISFACADLIPENSHHVSKCITINNIDNFEEYVIIGVITGPMIGDSAQSEYSIVELEQDVCMNKGYKYNKIHVYAIEKNYYKTIDDTGLNFESENVFKSNITTEPWAGYVNNSNPLTKVDLTLAIKEIANGELILETVSKINTADHPITIPTNNLILSVRVKGLTNLIQLSRFL